MVFLNPISPMQNMHKSLVYGMIGDSGEGGGYVD